MRSRVMQTSYSMVRHVKEFLVRRIIAFFDAMAIFFVTKSSWGASNVTKKMKTLECIIVRIFLLITFVCSAVCEHKYSYYQYVWVIWHCVCAIYLASALKCWSCNNLVSFCDDPFVREKLSEAEKLSLIDCTDGRCVKSIANITRK